MCSVMTEAIEVFYPVKLNQLNTEKLQLQSEITAVVVSNGEFSSKNEWSHKYGKYPRNQDKRVVNKEIKKIPPKIQKKLFWKWALPDLKIPKLKQQCFDTADALSMHPNQHEG